MWRLVSIMTCAVGALLAASPDPAMAASGKVREEQRIATCIRQASMGHAWLEKTLWGLRDQEAGWIGAEVRNSNGSHDLGPLQINSWWVPRIAARVGHSELQVRHWLRFDPCFNAEAARWIFLSGLRAAKDYWAAIGLYHSPTMWRQRRYSDSVASRIKKRFGERAFHERHSTPE